MFRIFGRSGAAVALALAIVAGAGVVAAGEEAGTGLVRVDQAYSLDIGRPLFSVYAGYFSRDFTGGSDRFFTFTPGVTLGLGAGFEGGASLALEGLSSRLDGEFFDRRFDVRRRDLATRLRWTAPLGTTRLRAGVEGLLGLPLGDQIRAGGTEDPGQPLDAGLLGLLSTNVGWFSFPIRIHANAGYWWSRDDGAFYDRSHPVALPVSGAGVNGNNLALAGLAIETGLRRVSLFAELVTEQFVEARSAVHGKENLWLLTPGLRTKLTPSIELTAAISFNLSADDPATAFNPNDVYPDYELRAGLTLGDILARERSEARQLPRAAAVAYEEPRREPVPPAPVVAPVPAAPALQPVARPAPPPGPPVIAPPERLRAIEDRLDRLELQNRLESIEGRLYRLEAPVAPAPPPAIVAPVAPAGAAAVTPAPSPAPVPAPVAAPTAEPGVAPSAAPLAAPAAADTVAATGRVVAPAAALPVPPAPTDREAELSRRLAALESLVAESRVPPAPDSLRSPAPAPIAPTVARADTLALARPGTLSAMPAPVADSSVLGGTRPAEPAMPPLPALPGGGEALPPVAAGPSAREQELAARVVALQMELAAAKTRPEPVVAATPAPAPTVAPTSDGSEARLARQIDELRLRMDALAALDASRGSDRLAVIQPGATPTEIRVPVVVPSAAPAPAPTRPVPAPSPTPAPAPAPVASSAAVAEPLPESPPQTPAAPPPFPLAVGGSLTLPGWSAAGDNLGAGSPARTELDALAAGLVAHRDVRLVLLVHGSGTDREAALARTESAARDLSSYLVSAGADSAQVQPLGMGLTEPVVPVDAPDAERNARVEVSRVR